jgi:hypothetical protein
MARALLGLGSSRKRSMAKKVGQRLLLEYKEEWMKGE